MTPIFPVRVVVDTRIRLLDPLRHEDELARLGVILLIPYLNPALTFAYEIKFIVAWDIVNILPVKLAQVEIGHNYTHVQIG